MYSGVTLGIFLREEAKGSKTFAEMTVTIGEDDDADLCFEDAGLQYHHASIHLLPEGAFVENDDSDGCTRLNGTAVRWSTKIKQGDTITAGEVRIVVEALIPEGTKIEIPPRYCAVKIMDRCPQCGSGLPINGVMRDFHCGACQQTVQFEDSYWQCILEDLDNDYDQGGGSYTINLQSRVTWKAMKPKCGKCGVDLPVERIPVGAQRDIRCLSCGQSTFTYPAPDWMKPILPSLSQIYGGERPAGTVLAEAVTAGEGAKPVILSCPQCRGALTITADSQRTIACQSCSADVFLPDDLWLRFHPVQTVGRWYLRFDGRRQKQIQRQIEEEALHPDGVAEVPSRFTIAKTARKIGSLLGFWPAIGIAIPLAIVALTWFSGGRGSGWTPEALDAATGRLGQVAFAIKKPMSFKARTDPFSVVWTPSPDSRSYVHVTYAPFFPGTAQEATAMVQTQFKTGMESAGARPVPGGFLAVLKDKAGRSVEAQVFRRKAAAGPGLLCTARVGASQGPLRDVDELVSYLTEICSSLSIN